MTIGTQYLQFFAGFALACMIGLPTAASGGQSACRDGFYVSTDFREAFVARHAHGTINWPMESLGSAQGIESALRPEAAQFGSPLLDCSGPAFRCVKSDLLHIAYAFPKSGKVGDSAHVAATVFKIANTYQSTELHRQFWVEFAADNGDVVGTFLYTAERGVLAITERVRGAPAVTLVLVQGHGLLTDDCSKAR